MLSFFINKNVKKKLFVCYNHSVRYTVYCLNIMSKFFVFRIATTIPTGTGKMMEQDVLSDESSTVATPLYVPTGVTRYM